MADVEGELKKKLDNYKADLSSNKDNIEKNTIKNLMEKKKVDSINSENLLNCKFEKEKILPFVFDQLSGTLIAIYLKYSHPKFVFINP